MSYVIERWIEVPFAPRYLVSQLGRVYDRVLERVLSQNPNKDGYYAVHMHVDGKRRTLRVHRLVALSFYDCDGVDLDVNHRDLDKSNNALWNLEFCTTSYNMKHAYRLGAVKMPKETRVMCVETGKEYRTMREAARDIGTSDHKSIMRVLDNPNRTAKGNHFVSVGR